MAQLLFSRHQAPLFQVRLQASKISIGRSEDCDVVLRERSISRQQAVIFEAAGQFLLKKQGHGPLLVNGEGIQQHLLKDHDKIEMGPWSARFRTFQEKELSEETEYSRHGREDTQELGAALYSSVKSLTPTLKIQILKPNSEIQYVALDAGEFYLGADIKNDLVLQDPYISSRHAKLSYESGSVWVQDLESTNGTYLNGVRIREGLWCRGETLKIGQCQFQLHETLPKSVEAISSETSLGALLGATSAMKKLYRELKQVAPTEATVLLLGESGSGKELAARAVHQYSSRASFPFVAVNCGAISRELIESELFGHEKGAFTGAGKAHAGAFGEAQGGTLFLDEIGELPLELQPKLLRVLENKTYRRVGGSQELKAEVRIIAATHRDLAQWVEEKRFREDLFFRLFVLPIRLPALRERSEDIPLLAQTFLSEFTLQQSKTLSQGAQQILRTYSYPGNVRELRNVLMRAVILSQGTVIQENEILFPRALQGELQAQTAKPTEEPRKNLSEGPQKLSEMEREMIERALIQAQGNKAQAARALGIAKSTLFTKIKLYQMDSENIKTS